MPAHLYAPQGPGMGHAGGQGGPRECFEFDASCFLHLANFSSPFTSLLALLTANMGFPPPLRASSSLSFTLSLASKSRRTPR